MTLGWDVVARNAAADCLFGFAGRDRVVRSFLRIVFADPEIRSRLPTFQEDGPRLIANFRYNLAVTPDNPALLSLVEDLLPMSADFRRWWHQPATGQSGRGISSFADGDAITRFRHEMMTVDEHRHLRIVVYFPRTD